MPLTLPPGFGPLVNTADLVARLAEAEETLRAIRRGEVDALMVEGSDGPQVYILQGLDAATNRFRGEILGQVSDAVIAVDGGSRITYLNAAAERLYGLTASEALGQTLPQIYCCRWRAAEDEEVANAALREHGEWRGENVHVRRRDGREIDVESSVSMLREAGGQPAGLLSVIRDITKRKQSEDQVRLLMGEVNHRAKNLLAVVLAVAQQTAKYGDLPSYVQRLSDRIEGLAAGQDLLVRNHWQGVDVADLVEAQLIHFKDLIGTRIQIGGPRAELTTVAAQGIGMALRELATNAAKYGALSNHEGRVKVSWQITAAAKPEFFMCWLEDGGPTVVEPVRMGFGHVVIGRMAEASVRGTAEISFGESGLSWTLRAALNDALVPNGVAA